MTRLPEAAQKLAAYIDHTILKPEATPTDIENLCNEARQYQFAAVCVNPVYVKLAADLLTGSGVAVCAVVGFPLGANATAVTCFETKQAIKDGATEIDMVIHVGGLKAGNTQAVKADMSAIVQTAHQYNVICKVILETALLNEAEKVLACQLAQQAGADYVKTSTGFSSGGATLADVTLMRQTVGPLMGVKASGGIRDYATAQKMITAGASRLGLSAGVQIIQEAIAASR